MISRIVTHGYNVPAEYAVIKVATLDIKLVLLAKSFLCLQFIN